MKVKEELEITITGKDVNIRVIEGEGKSCIGQTKELEDSLGKVVKREFCDDYYKKPKVFNQQKTEQKMQLR